ncbi:competence protein TfoX [Anaerocolumna cellulosilytica]|uniref:Competence protein TfoX n=1 Tax=Anaerocolumna cellulosilytica TaxID=433286 RepID=A0A6S6R100_9FIRM|nr:TfoX/Sxy family protein [Anaerocolumna cellulosilytica]MBB5195684.1 DNA transformation protein [Anaerocolumna cellulosilytica]BCJ92980.1 competence protein TfoX [Anaerocolumna cellulosilytica]
MHKLTELPNIGKVIENRLNAIGIYTLAELISIGSREAFFHIKLIDNTACLHMLYALQGAVEGKRYTQLSKSTKQELKQFFDCL